MAEQHISLADLPHALAKDLRGLRRRVRGALVATAKAGVATCTANVPAQFVEVAAGIESFGTPDGAVIRSSAPHAEAVELGKQRAKKWNGLPAVEDLAAWVRAHGSGRGKTAVAIRKTLRSYESRGSSPADAPLQVAWAIIGSINKHDTAHQYMARSIEAIEADMALRIENALEGGSITDLVTDAVRALAGASSLGADGALGSGRRRLRGAARKLARTSGARAR